MTSTTNNINAQHQLMKEDDTPTFRSVSISATTSRGDCALSLRTSINQKETLHTNTSYIENDEAPRWNINEKTIPIISPFFSLERTHVVVNDSASKIANRVANCLKDLSISSKYNEDKKKSVVKAETLEGVRFNIRFFRHDQRRNAIILEVQRRRGNSFGYQNVARAVLASAEGSSMGAVEDGRCHCVSKMSIPSSVVMDYGGDGNIEEVQHQRRKRQRSGEKYVLAENKEVMICSSLERIVSLVQAKQYDSKLLGMKALKSLTSVDLCGVEVAKMAAKFILGVNKQEKLSELQGVIIALLQHDGHEGDVDDEDVERRYVGEIRSCALCVLKNALSVVSDDDELWQLILCGGSSSSSWFKNNMIPFVLEEISNAECRPHDALRALKCLAVGVSISKELRALALGLGVTSLMDDISKRKHDIGHSLLEDEMIRTRISLKAT